jgi:ribosome modulation factor
LLSAKKRDQWVRGWLTREKARPTPCSLLLLAWWVGSEVCSRLKFLGANGDVAQKPATPLASAKKRDQCVQGWRKPQKSKANMKKQGQPLAPAVVLVVGGEVCSGQRFFGQMVRVAKSSDAFLSAKKRAQWGRGWLTREKARPTPCSSRPCPLLQGQPLAPLNAPLLGCGVLVAKVFCANGGVEKSR